MAGNEVGLRTVYMEVTTDRLSLPVAIADSCVELGQIRGVSPDVISTHIYRYKVGKFKKERFVKVEIEVDEDE